MAAGERIVAFARPGKRLPGKPLSTFPGSCFGIGAGSHNKRRKNGGRPGSLQLDIIVPVLMCCALLWWVGRGMSWTARLAVTAITLAIIIAILLVERSRF